MYSLSLHSIVRASEQTLVALLIGALVFFGGPTAYLFADEGGEQETTEETTSQEEQTQEDTETESDGTSGNSGNEGEATGADGDEGTDGSEGDAEASDESNDTADTENGTEGGEEEDNGDNGGDGTDSGTGDSTVTTGDSTAEGDVTNVANTNETTTDGGDDDDASGTDDDTASTSSSTVPINTTTDIENDNEATTTTDAEIESTTGANAAAGGGSASVTTGNAIAAANVVNVVNTNIVNSVGLLYFLNLLFGDVALDMRDLFSVFTSSDDHAPECSFTDCGDRTAEFNVENDSIAYVDNDVVLRAQTGENTATAGNGTAAVSTGNAYAAANVVNVVNTNIVDSNYLLLSVNNFGDFEDDIIFPGADFFSDIFSGNARALAGTSFSSENDNTATVSNIVEGEADTGGNSAEAGTEGSAAIATGDAEVAANVVNTVNQNFIGDSLSILFRVHGDWSGNIFGLPEGVTWSQTPNGIQLTLDPTAHAHAGGGTALAGTNNTVALANSNEATIDNNVSVYALTGDNHAAAETGSAEVSTGDAYAAANVVNVANTNVVGRNWVMAIFNIFGDWTGDITFGQPDLWVGARTEVPQYLSGGSCFEYVLTVNNFGDADATNVVLNTAFDRVFQDFENFDEDLEQYLQWNLGRISGDGGSKEVHLPVCLTNLAGNGQTIITDFEVDSDQNDANDDDNYEQISLTTYSKSTGGAALRLEDADLEIVKEASESTIEASSTVTYTIHIKNKGGPVYHALLIDTIEDMYGDTIHEQRWGLETIYPHEEISISYDVVFNGDTEPGFYTNTAFLSGVEKHPDFEHNYGDPIDSPVAEAIVEVVGLPGGLLACNAYLTSYIRDGANNEVGEVEKLQAFLIEYEGVDSISITGEYDEATQEAVHAFQDRHANDVLIPWGIDHTTGFVYYTTQKKVNEIYCAGTRQFPLNSTQLQEIEQYKHRSRSYEEQGVEIPEEEWNNVGSGNDNNAARLADATQPASINENENVKQRAATVEAISPEDAATLFDMLRTRLENIFNWVSVKVDETKEISLK